LIPQSEIWRFGCGEMGFGETGFGKMGLNWMHSTFPAYSVKTQASLFGCF